MLAPASVAYFTAAATLERDAVPSSLNALIDRSCTTESPAASCMYSAILVPWPLTSVSPSEVRLTLATVDVSQPVSISATSRSPLAISSCALRPASASFLTESEMFSVIFSSFVLETLSQTERIVSFVTASSPTSSAIAL